jgi:arabinose-5-phosphate isomerase
VAGLADRLGSEFHKAVDILTSCADRGGTVLVTGLGKSGLIGAKISATFASLGIPSHTVHPTEAAHGDLGRFRPTDCCLALSYSGETAEVVAVASILRQDGIPIITITRGGSPQSSLERLASASLTVGPVDEANGISPAPTCSTTAMLALGDALALAASRRRNFTDDDFARRHPGGALGGLLRPVTEALRFTVGKNLAAVPDNLTVNQALAAAETGRRPGALLLVDSNSGRLTGIFTDADLRRLLLKDRSRLEAPVRDAMTRSPATLPHTALIRDAVQMVREFRRDEIPVIDGDGRPVGLLDVQDLVAMRLIESE